MKRLMKQIFCSLLAVVTLWSAASAYSAEISLYMTYRDNSVKLTSAAGISITNGTFKVNELSITPGQDPDGRNYVGQILTLQGGEFSFSMGRSGSAEVAKWLNEKLSGYNDTSVNGDRTTFDHTADALNFAFIGDLSLGITTDDYPQGIDVLFPNVAFAQGSTLFSNNWWFGQVTGQHTRDSDGPNSLLVIGTDAAGQTVFASFVRGGNGVNEISLEALFVASDAKDIAEKVSNVEAKFKSLPVDGTQTDLKGFPGSYDPTMNHIQGYSIYKNSEGLQYSLLTHSVGTASYAHIVAGPTNGSDKWGFKTYLENWQHPGGIQVIGDYVLVPSEHDTEAHVALYDLRSLEVGELRRVETFDLHVPHKAGALGITSYTDANGVEYYVLVVAHLDETDSVYHVYKAAAADGLENAQFSEIGSFPFEKDFQGFGLVTEVETNNVYLVGLWSPSEGATFADYAYLYQLNTQNGTLGEELDQIHLKSVGGAVGMLGVHFRYGASVFVGNNDNFIVSATERNSVLGSALATNDWIPAN